MGFNYEPNDLESTCQKNLVVPSWFQVKLVANLIKEMLPSSHCHINLQQVDVRQGSGVAVWHCNKHWEMAEKFIAQGNCCKEGWGPSGECI